MANEPGEPSSPLSPIQRHLSELPSIDMGPLMSPMLSVGQLRASNKYVQHGTPFGAGGAGTDSIYVNKEVHRSG